MRTVRSGPIVGFVMQFLLLVGLSATAGLGAAGWFAGMACGAFTAGALARALARTGRRLGPADRVTLVRAILVGAVTALIADSFRHHAMVGLLVGLASVALVLDAVDGWVARRTRSVSDLGARFDMEVDAFLILVLSVYVARTSGAWILAIGAARYAFVAAGWLLPWMRGALPPRYWRKVVAAVQGIVLAVVAAGILPRWLATLAAAVALAMLAESFGRDVQWLWRHRQQAVNQTEAGRVSHAETPQPTLGVS